MPGVEEKEGKREKVPVASALAAAAAREDNFEFSKCNAPPNPTTKAHAKRCALTALRKLFAKFLIKTALSTVRKFADFYI